MLYSKRASKAFVFEPNDYLLRVDNITLNAGSGGSVCAADDVSSVFYQRIKLTPGGDGAAAYATTAAKYVSAAGANQDANVFKSAAGVLYSIVATTVDATPVYVHLHNSTGPTSATAAVQTFMLPTNGGVAITFPLGIEFSTGISTRITTGVASSSTAAATTDEVVINVTYV